MPIEALTYAALGARLNISPKAARSLAKRLHLPSSLSDDGKALVSVDLAEGLVLCLCQPAGADVADAHASRIVDNEDVVF